MNADLPAFLPVSSLGEPVYRGSVQNLYAVPDHPAYLVCETTEAGSVFDVGSIFKIEGNDLNRAIFRHALYQKLGQAETWQRVAGALDAEKGLGETWKSLLIDGLLPQMIEKGASTHHVGMLDAVTGELVKAGMPKNPSCFNVVRRFPVMKPPQRNVMGNFVFDYAQFQQNTTYVVPLEYIVRFGVTSGSSILRKYETLSDREKRAFEHELGLQGPMQAWQTLQRPIFDLTSKYEPEDRAVTKQEALLMSGLSAELFTHTIRMALLGAWAVKEMLREIGLVLWDLKWEFAADGDELFFVDTLDADSFRATNTVPVDGRELVIHYNKQAMRDYYRVVCADWYGHVNTAKAEAAKSGRPFKEVLKEGQNQGRFLPTPVVDAAFLQLQAQKTALIKEHVLGSESAESVKAGLREAGQAEAEFYRQAGKLNELLAINAL